MAKKGINQIIVVGNLGKDAEMKYTPNGKPVTSFSLAATTGYGEYEHTEWFNCVAWGERFANVVNFLKKGKTIGVSGMIKTRSWEDDKGKRNFRTELIVNDITLLSSGGDQSAAPTEAAGDTDGDAPTGTEDEIPF